MQTLKQQELWGVNRSKLMSLIRLKDNRTTEGRIITALRASKITGWRRHQKLLGKPDFLFYREKVALFVDGCFWHGCPKCYRRPRTNTSYWNAKVKRNKRRDLAVSAGLRQRGWKVVR